MLGAGRAWARGSPAGRASRPPLQERRGSSPAADTRWATSDQSSVRRGAGRARLCAPRFRDSQPRLTQPCLCGSALRPHPEGRRPTFRACTRLPTSHRGCQAQCSAGHTLQKVLLEERALDLELEFYSSLNTRSTLATGSGTVLLESSPCALVKIGLYSFIAFVLVQSSEAIPHNSF